jgi:hypothetical protein
MSGEKRGLKEWKSESGVGKRTRGRQSVRREQPNLVQVATWLHIFLAATATPPICNPQI